MNETKLPKLKLEWYNNITFEFNCSDPNLEDMFNAFKTLMIGATFREDMIDNFIIELGKELEWDKKEETKGTK